MGALERQPGTYSGTLSYFNTADTYDEFAFKGTSVTLIGCKAVNRGVAEVFLDGKSLGKIDMYALASEKCDCLFGKRSEGRHPYPKAGSDRRAKTKNRQAAG